MIKGRKTPLARKVTIPDLVAFATNMDRKRKNHLNNDAAHIDANTTRNTR